MSWSTGLIVLLLIVLALWGIAELVADFSPGVDREIDRVAERKRRDAARAYRTKMGIKE